MKKVILNYLVITSLVIFSALTSCSDCGCDDDIYIEDEVQLLKTIKYDGVSSFYRYEYDTENRIEKISFCGGYGMENEILLSSQTFTYNEDDLVRVVEEKNGYPEFGSTTEFIKSGNKITMTKKYNNDEDDIIATIDLNNDGFLTKYEEIRENDSQVVIIYQINGGNMTKYSYKSTWRDEIYEFSIEYKYDNKKSQFYHCNTPKWYLMVTSDYGIDGSQNNVIEQSWNGGEKSELKYEYDNSGYPIKCTKTTKWEGYDDIELLEFVKEYKYE